LAKTRCNGGDSQYNTRTREAELAIRVQLEFSIEFMDLAAVSL